MAKTKEGVSSKPERPGIPPVGKGKADEAKLPPRKRVHQAQLNVLEQVEKILNGNCKSATKGNYNCAKFVLDWSAVSDIRTPLARPLKQKSLAGTLLKKLKKTAAENKQKAEEAAVPK
jgi:hypothetical protein